MNLGWDHHDWVLMVLHGVGSSRLDLDGSGVGSSRLGLDGPGVQSSRLDLDGSAWGWIITTGS